MKDFLKSRRVSLCTALILAFAIACAGPAKAQTFFTLRNLATADGTFPIGSVITTNGVLYGTAYSGGSAGYGTVFRINTDGTQFSVLHNFALLQGTNSTNIDGAGPRCALLLGTNNLLYGTTSMGGTNGTGTIFSLQTNGINFTVLHHFTHTNGTLGTNLDGANPSASLILTNATLYGTAQNGGGYGNGTVFRILTNGIGFTVLHTFPLLNSNYPYGNLDGAKPVSSLLLSNDTLFGTASTGGFQGSGTVFKLNTNSTLFTTLHYFPTLSYSINGEGAYPFGGLVLTNGFLYGTATNGGTAGKGTIFAISTDGTTFTNLHNFIDYTDGSYPLAGLILFNSKLAGTASQGGSNLNGTIFSMETNGTGFTNLYNFSPRSSGANIDGAYPFTSLLALNGELYSTTQQGGTSRNGTLFKLSVHPAFFAGEASLGNNVYYLVFPNNNLFGYYSYQYFPYLYHYDLGFEYFIDANDGVGGAYLYDFTSGHFWYTSPTYPFPFLYDFSLNAVLYYYPDTTNSGHYTTNPRYFHNFGNGMDFTM